MVSVIQAWGLASLFAVFVPTAAWPWALKREANNAIPTEDVGATVTIHPFSLDSTSLSQVVESLESVLSTLPASLYSEGTSDVLGLTTAVTFTIATTLSSPEPEVSTSFVTVTTESTVTETQNAASVLSAALQTFTTTTIAVASQPTSPPSSAVLAPPPPSAAASSSSSSTSTTTITITSTTTAADTSTSSTPNALSVLSAALATFPPSLHPTTTYTSFAPPPLPERPLPSSSTDDADIYPALSLLTTVTQTITLSDTSTGTLTFTSASTGVSTWTSAFPISTRTVTYASPRPESGSVGAGAGTSEVSVWGSVVESLDRSVSAAATATATGTGTSGAGGASAGASASGGGGGGGGGGDGDGAAASSTAAAATGAGVSVGREGGCGGLVMAVVGLVVGVVEVAGL